MIDLDRALSELDGAQLVRQAEAAPDVEYVFKHTLVQEAAYASLLKSSRTALHLQIAETLERATAGRHEGVAAVLAWHYDRAGREDKVLEHALQAGDAAGAVRAYAEAGEHYDRALLAANRLDPIPLEACALARKAFANRGALLEAQNRFAEAAANYTDLIAFAARHGDVAAESEATNHLVTVRILREGPGADVLEAAERALDLAERSGVTVLVGRAVWNLGLYYRFVEPDRAMAHLDRARNLALSQTPMTREARELAASALTDSIIAAFPLGQNRRAEAGARQTIEEYRSLGNLNLLANAYGSLAFALHLGGRPSEARAAAEECVDIGSRILSPWLTFYGRFQVTYIAIDAGRFEAFVAEPTGLITLADQTNFGVFVGLAHSHAARAWIALGLPARAVSHAQVCQSQCQATGTPNFQLMSCGVLTLAMLKAGRRDDAEAASRALWAMLPGDRAPRDRIQGACYALDAIAESLIATRQFDRGIAFCDWFLSILEPEDMRRFVAETRRWRGRMFLEVGALDRAGDDFARAEAWMREAKADALLWPLCADLARLHARRGDAAAAEEARARAAALIRAIAGRIADPALRAHYAGWERTLHE